MPQLVVRNIEESSVRKLRARAAKDGISMEEEHRRILREALLQEPAGNSFLEVLQSMPDPGDESVFERRNHGAFRDVEL